MHPPSRPRAAALAGDPGREERPEVQRRIGAAHEIHAAQREPRQLCRAGHRVEADQHRRDRLIGVAVELAVQPGEPGVIHCERQLQASYNDENDE